MGVHLVAAALALDTVALQVVAVQQDQDTAVLVVGVEVTAMDHQLPLLVLAMEVLLLEDHQVSLQVEHLQDTVDLLQVHLLLMEVLLEALQDFLLVEHLLVMVVLLVEEEVVSQDMEEVEDRAMTYRTGSDQWTRIEAVRSMPWSCRRPLSTAT